jgi:hypothetical protein
MEDFYNYLTEQPMGLMVSLPRNEVELARAAVAGGAHALKIHINVRHAASGTQFGSFDEERDCIASIIETAGVPVGIMPGAAETATVEQLAELRDMGIQFYDVYLHDMPTAYLTLDGIEGMPALAEGFDPAVVKTLGRWGFRMLEISSVPHGDYGKPLNMEDMAVYASVAESFPGICVVPTQKAIRPDELKALAAAGVKAVMIGKIVTGDSSVSICENTAAFRKAIDSLI